jgi:hypothetical protein
VDINMQLNRNQDMHGRDKRAAFIGQFIFTTGARLIWGLLGFLDKMRMKQKIRKIESTLSRVEGQVGKNSKDITDLSKIIYAHSIAIDQLTVATSELDRRVDAIERKMDDLEKQLAGLVNKLDYTISLSLVANLITRTQQSLNTGYDTLREIIHSSLLGQTSPLLLPAEQIELIQNKVLQASDGVLDTDFAKMKSVIVSDPEDSQLLLVIINAAALSKREVELVKLVPIPYYDGAETFIPVLDYDTVLLDHLAGTYSILNAQEEAECLFNRCYNSDVERNIQENSCGVPQRYDQQRDVCMYESTLSQGMFIKPMLPDGILFAFRSTVTTQLFCNGNHAKGDIKKLNGTGVLKLPNGCILSIKDDKGRITQVKGQPLSRMIDAGSVDLIVYGPLSTLFANNKNGTHKIPIYGSLVTDHMLTMVSQMESVDTKISKHTTFIWGLMGIISILIMCISIAAIGLFRFSGKFRQKIYDLRDSFDHLVFRLSNVETKQDGTPRGLPPPVAPRPPVNLLLSRAATHKRSANPLSSRESESSSYLNMDEFNLKSEVFDECKSFKFTPINKNYVNIRDRYYPSSPVLPSADSNLGDQLLSEQKEMEELCDNKVSTNYP